MYIREIFNEFVNCGYIDEQTAERLAALGEIDQIVKDGFCTEGAMLEVLGKYYGLPVSHIDSLEIDASILERYSKLTVIKNKFLPVSIQNGVMTVAICDPTDFISLSPIKAGYQGEISYILVVENQLCGKIQSLFAEKSATSAINDVSDNSADNSRKTTTAEEIQNAPAVKLVDSLINEAISFKASDIHIEPMEKTVRVRYRIDGSLYERAEFPIDTYSSFSARLKILAGINIAERRLPQDGHINTVINNVEYDFRVSTMPTVNGEKFVVRILDKSAFTFTREELGFTKDENIIVDKMLAHPHGIILLTGPTGCGKTTTLYSFLKELNKIQSNIVTVEDPVEYTLQGINQTQVNNKANLTFASALRSILRQDPDIIMIGEIRDEETAQIAIRAATTGHLVFSTLHTNDAPGSVIRLLDMGIKSYFLADSLVGIIAQRLVKKLCPICKTKATSTLAETVVLNLAEPVDIYHPQGCPFCNYTGYKGRTAVHEIMYLNDKLRSAINEHVVIDQLRNIARDESGMVPLWEACRQLVLDGTTDLTELMNLFNE